MAAFVVRGAGATVVKHGNRAASSACGSADLLEELGVVIDLPPDSVRRCIDEAGIGFCFAPVFHPALRHAAVPRRELGVPTFFNVLGPLTNPAQPSAQAVGVPDARIAPVMAGVLARRGTTALVFRGDDGLDELTTTTTSHVWVAHDGSVTETVIDPADLSLAKASADDLRGGSAAVNAETARAVLSGQSGPVRDAVLLNAAAALTALDRPDPARLTEQLAAALTRAAAAIDDARAADALTRWVATSQAAAARG
jgi:anthranilate phosphoribosyltransferase